MGLSWFLVWPSRPEQEAGKKAGKRGCGSEFSLTWMDKYDLINNDRILKIG